MSRFIKPKPKKHYSVELKEILDDYNRLRNEKPLPAIQWPEPREKQKPPGVIERIKEVVTPPPPEQAPEAEEPKPVAEPKPSIITQVLRRLRR